MGPCRRLPRRSRSVVEFVVAVVLLAGVGELVSKVSVNKINLPYPRPSPPHHSSPSHALIYGSSLDSPPRTARPDLPRRHPPCTSEPLNSSTSLQAPTSFQASTHQYPASLQASSVLLTLPDLPPHIPSPHAPVVIIGDHYFELNFEVEPLGFDDNGVEVHMDMGSGDGNDDQGTEEDGFTEYEGGRDGKRSRTDTHGDNSSTGLHGAAPSANTSAMQGMSEMMEGKIHDMANEIVDMAVDKTLDWCADKVMAEYMATAIGEFDEGEDDLLGDDVLNGTPVGQMASKAKESGRPASSLATQEMIGSATVAAGRAAQISPMAAGQEQQPPAQTVLPGEAKASSGGAAECKVEKRVAAAAVEEAVNSPIRSSPRLAGHADQHVLEKAKMRAAKRNLDVEGNLQSNSLDKNLVYAA